MNNKITILEGNLRMLNNLVNVERFLLREFNKTHNANILQHMKQIQTGILILSLAIRTDLPIATICVRNGFNVIKTLDFFEKDNIEFTNDEISLVINAARNHGISYMDNANEFHELNKQLLLQNLGKLKRWRRLD